MRRAALNARIRPIRVVVLDADGVMTDGRIRIDSAGGESQVFDIQDGLGIVLLRKAGHRVAILTSRSTESVMARARELDVDRLYQGSPSKGETFARLLSEMNVVQREVAYVGDDLLDLPVLRQVGLPVAVRNAVPEVKNVAAYITRKRGGSGAVREVAELILKTQRRWKGLVDELRGDRDES